MKFKHILGIIFLALGFFACGSSGPSEAELAAEAEANRLDSLNQILKETAEEMDKDASALEAALDSLTLFFPEEE